MDIAKSSAKKKQTKHRRGFVEEVKFNIHINNLEILSKLMNSVAKKCDCAVKYNAKNKSLVFTGDKKYKRLVVEETINFLSNRKP